MQTIRLSRRALLASALLAAAALPAQAFSLFPVSGSGQRVEESRHVDAFDKLKLDTNVRVVVRQGERASVKVEADDNVVSLIDTHVVDGALVIENNKEFKSSIARVHVTVRELTSIETAGSVSLLAEDLRLPALSLATGGSSAVNLRRVTVPRLRVALGGSSALRASGASDDFSLAVGGSSQVQASGLNAKAVNVSGGGSAQVFVWATESLRLSLGGSVDVGYYGTVHPVQSTSGSVSVRHLGAAPVK